MLKPILLLSLCILMTQSCHQRNGCTDPVANNYTEHAENDDGSCRYDDELFTGRWKVRDTIINGKDIKAGEEKVLTILSAEGNKADLRLIWKNAGGQNSDTLKAQLVPLAISIPEQPYENKICKGSIIYMFYLNDPVPKIRISYILADQQGNAVEIRGVGEKLN